MDKIEEKLAQLERLTEELSDIVARQDREIAALQTRVGMLVERELSRESDGGVILGDERPPHY